MYRADARKLPLADASVDVIVTSPPYWRKRDYGYAAQIGQEPTVTAYIAALRKVLREWWRVLRPTGSVFVNIGDTYWQRSLVGVPALLENAARQGGWLLRNRIVWAKDGGLPSAARNRLVNRHEFILHLTKSRKYYYDLLGYCQEQGCQGKPGDVWELPRACHAGKHPAPFHPELVKRAILLGCPQEVCSTCGTPRSRRIRRTLELDATRPQARRAMQIAREAGLRPEHYAAIQATGISDAGKGADFQVGAKRNSAEVRRLAAEAKEALGGYFREYTFPRWETDGWDGCDCAGPSLPGVVLDPFAGTGTTLRVATALGRRAVGVDLCPGDLSADQLEAPKKPTRPRFRACNGQSRLVASTPIGSEPAEVFNNGRSLISVSPPLAA